MPNDFDFSEVHKLAVDLGRGNAATIAGARAILQKGALNIKNGMRSDAKGIRHAPAFPASITYDTKITPFGAEAEIGPDKSKRQGALGNILYFGTSNNAPVIADYARPLKVEAPIFEKFLGDLAAKYLL